MKFNEFKNFVNKVTKPIKKTKDVAVELDLSVQQLYYYTTIKPAIHPDEECPAFIKEWVEKNK